MPQLVKGGKWVFGWAIVGPGRVVIIPPQAWDEYGFQVSDEVTFIAGSRRSGGFGLSHERLLRDTALVLGARALARGRIEQRGQVTVPAAVGVQAGDRLLVVRGSGRALGFLTRGPIYEEALRHPELRSFGPTAEP
ncbi:MAG: hypothetical protein P8129_13120 [Anaerolineae bacterium]